MIVRRLPNNAHRPRARHALAAIATLVLGVSAHADDDGNASSGQGEQLDTIAIEAEASDASGPVNGYIADRSDTATKTDVPLIETPQSISVISREQLDDRGADSLTDAVTYAPGIDVDNRASKAVIDTFEIEIRGFSAQNATYRDGTQIQAGLPFSAPIEPFGLERVEILRGPSSILYGQGQPGGIINLVTKRPTDQPLYEVGVEYGSYDHRQVTADVSDRLDAEGNWRYRVTALAQESDSHIDFIHEDRTYLAPAVTWSPNERTELTLLAQYQENKTRYPWRAFPREGTQYPSQFGTIPDSRYIGEPSFDRYDSTEYSLGYIFEHRFGDRWKFQQNVRYREVEYDRVDTFRNFFGQYVSADLSTAINRFNRAAFDEGETTTIDNRLTSIWQHNNVEHTVLVGVDYKTLTYDERDSGFDPISGSASSLDLYNPQYGRDFSRPSGFTETTTEADQTGLYLQDHVRIGERWALTLGGRQDWVSEKSTGQSEEDQDELSLRAGAVYLGDGGWAPYLSYAESFTPEYGSNPVSAEEYDPITGEQIEFGVRYRPPGTGLSATAAVFDITRENEVVQNPANPGNPNDQVQAGETKSEGFELSVLADLTSNLKATASYTRQEVTLAEAGGIGTNEGNRLTEKPEELARIWLDYTVGEGPLAGFGLGGGVRYQGESFADSANTLEYPASTLVDAALRYQWGPNLRLQLTATNLFDEQPVYCDGSRPGQPDDTCRYGVPREVIAGVRYSW